jgi:alpha-glucosidase
MEPAMTNEWWRGAVIYQIYPRSIKDTNGDGIGDLKGITEKLPYVASLGVDAVWLSPFFKSPMKDFGYDVSDYCDVDPMFGTVRDFKVMLKKAHALGIKIIIDMVLSHTSDEHDWFKQSAANRTNGKADWYVWADPKPDGTPPTNWMSVFGGPSWTYNVRRGQYYMHNFLTSQPDLNLHNKDVRKALLEDMRFWLEMGVDGFRLDAMTHFFYKKLADNPPNKNPQPAFFNVDFPVPFTMQQHINDVSMPHTLKFAKDIRALLDEYPGRMSVAEIGGDNGIVTAAQITAGRKNLHTAYNFSLISGHEPSAKLIRSYVEQFERQPGGGWPAWAFSNHDVVRVLSRWGAECDYDPRLAFTLLAALCSLRGTVFVYEGEELGLTDAVIPYDRIQDPWGIYLYPEWQGRDGCRTPMPWTKEKKRAGFSKGEPWLPIPDNHRARSVDVQEKDRHSTLNLFRAFTKWRKTVPALQTGGIKFFDGPNDRQLCFIRHDRGGDVLCIFNFSGKPSKVKLPKAVVAPKGEQFTIGAVTGALKDGTAILPAFGVFCQII